MKKRQKSLFFRLIGSYIILILLVIFAIGVGVICFALQYQGIVENGKTVYVSQSEVLNQEGTLRELSFFSQSNSAWIELLDEKRKVLEIKGSKKDNTMQYAPSDLEALKNRENGPFYCDILIFHNQEGQVRYCLVKYGKDNIQFKASFTKEEKYFLIMNEQGVVLNFLLFRNFLLCFALCVLYIFLLSFWVNQKVKKPLSYIKEGFEKIGQGNAKTQLTFKAESEFEAIRDSFNHMATDLNSAIEEKEKVEQSRKMMLLNLSHDIRTPVATIKGYATALQEGLITEEDKKEQYYNTILLKSERISSLVDELFEYLKLENKDYEIRLEKININEFLRESVVEFYNEIQDNGFELEVSIPEQVCEVMIHPQWMNRAIGNLIGNALKYNKRGTHLTVCSEVHGKDISISICDNGVGIPKEIRGNMFDPFILGDNARQTSGGTGLGLAIVKAIIERHNGMLMYKDVKVGSCFEIILPVLHG